MQKLLILIWISGLLSCNLNRGGAYLSSISTIPSFDMLLLDSVTELHSQDIPTGKPIVMVYFRPDCPHCQLETKILISSMGKLKDCRIYFVTAAGLGDTKNYAHDFHLDQYPNIITVGKDYKRAFARVFHPDDIPFLAIYSDQKELVKVYHGEVGIKSVLAAIHG